MFLSKLKKLSSYVALLTLLALPLTSHATVSATTSFEYDVSGYLLTAKNLPDGSRVEYTYGDINYPRLVTAVTTKVGSTVINVDNFTFYEVVGTGPDVGKNNKGLLQEIKTAVGTADERKTTFTHNLRGLVTSKTIYMGGVDPDLTWTYTYDTKGWLATETDPSNTVTTYIRNTAGLPTKKTITDSAAVKLGEWVYTYNANNEILSTQGSGIYNTVTRDFAGRVITDTDNVYQSNSTVTGSAAGYTEKDTITTDGFNNVTKILNPANKALTMTYDATGRLTKRTWHNEASPVAGAPGIKSESFTYDMGDAVLTHTNTEGGVTSYTYTQAGQVSSTTDPTGRTTQWEYTPYGRKEKEIQHNGTTIEWDYDLINRVVTATWKKPDTTVIKTTSVKTNPHGEVIESTDAEGNVATKTYDKLGRVLTSTFGGVTTTTVYTGLNTAVTTTGSYVTTALKDGLGRIVKLTTGTGTDSVEKTFTYSLNTFETTTTTGLLTEAIVTKTIVNNYGQLSGEKTGANFFRNVYTANTGGSFTNIDELNLSTAYVGNGWNEVTKETAVGGQVTDFTYDKLGGLKTRSMAQTGGALVETIAVNSAGQTTETKLVNTTNEIRNYQTQYFATGAWQGLVEKTTHPDGTESVVEYDELNRITKVTRTHATEASKNIETSYEYNKNNQVTKLTENVNGVVTEIIRTYDALGLVTETAKLDGTVVYTTTQTRTDGVRTGLEAAWTTGGTQTFGYGYSSGNQLNKVTFDTKEIDYEYATTGLLKKRIGEYKEVTYTRDAKGRITNAVTKIAGTQFASETNVFAADDKRTSWATTRVGDNAWNQTLAYTYGAHKRRSATEQFSTKPGSYDTLNYTFNGLGVRTSAYVTSKAPTKWENTLFSANGFAQVLTDRDNSVGFTTIASGTALGANYVTTVLNGQDKGLANHPGSSDPVGAWTKPLWFDAGVQTFSATAVFPVASPATASQTFTASVALEDVVSTYDLVGRTLTKTWVTDLRTETYTWDSKDRIAKIAVRTDALDNGFNWYNTFDGADRRIRTVKKNVVSGVEDLVGTETWYLFDPEVEFLEVSVKTGSDTYWKIHGPDINGTYGSLQGTGGIEAVADNLGNWIEVVNDTFGNVVGTSTGTIILWNPTRVGAYGLLPSQQVVEVTDLTSFAQAHAWRSKAQDATGLYNLGLRAYESKSGRFLSPDPLGHGASMNLYDYAGGDPVNGIDPDGRLVKGWQSGATGNIGADDNFNGSFYQYARTYGAIFSGATEGATGGTSILTNTLSFGGSDALGWTESDQYQGGVYTASRISATVGREALITAATLGTAQLARAGVQGTYYAAAGLEGINAARSGFQIGQGAVQVSEGKYLEGGLNIVGGSLGASGSLVSGVVTIKPNIVYRALNEADEAALAAGKSLSARNPLGTNTAAEHIANTDALQSAWISTTKDLSIAKAYAGDGGRSIVTIDLNKIKQPQLEIWKTIDRNFFKGKEATTEIIFQRSFWAQEVTIHKEIPLSAILKKTN